MKDARFAPGEYEAFRVFLEQACGIVLGDNKQYLVMSRLGKVLNEAHLGSLGELVRKLKEEHGGPLREQVVEAMTTNETFWFRDRHPFDIFHNRILPDLLSRKLRQARVWSAACSTGQEPYSISMVTEEFLAANRAAAGMEVQITGTDISSRVLEEARAGVYDSLALSRGLSAERRQRFFVRDPLHWSERWQVKPEIRRRTRFTQANLLQSYATLGRFDVIFCRNVLIYFSSELKTDILARMARALNPGGYLVLGASESITQYSDEFTMERCQPGVIYRVKELPR
ncbi:MAG: protein-glutamate O-methyltransferase CheR [Gammaproteobacteria bacterium]|nr:protein-glutamate O-methyltransferase CheR [Gammaproteobacteria bacterium]